MFLLPTPELLTAGATSQQSSCLIDPSPPPAVKYELLFSVIS